MTKPSPARRSPLRFARNLAMIYATLGILMTALITLHWFLVLEPTLRADAQSHSRVLAQVQASNIEQRLGGGRPGLLRWELETSLDRLLLLKDQATGLPFVRRIALEMDNEQLDGTPGSLDMARGVEHCPDCFVSEIPLYHPHDGQLVGVSTFHTSPQFLESMIADFRVKLLWIGGSILCFLGFAWLGTGRLLRRLGESESRLQSLLDNTPAIIYVKDLEGRCQLVNPRFEALLGVRKEDLPGKTPDQIFPDETARRFMENDQALVTSMTPRNLEQTIETADGLRTLLSTQFPIFNDTGVATGVCGIALDITERKQTEQALKVALAKYRTLFDAFPFGITVMDATGRITETNPASEHLLGISKAEQMNRRIDSPEWFTQRPDGSRMPSDEYPAVQALARQTVIRDREMGVTQPSGKVRWIGVTAAPLPIDGLGAVVVYEDITLRREAQAAREAEAALRESERRFRIMADELPLIIWVQDTSIFTAFVNKTCCTYFGVSEESLTGQRWLPLVHPDDQTRFFASFSASCEARIPFHDQCRMRRADGEWRWLESFARPSYGPDGTFTGIVGTSLDITERKAADEALLESHRELERRAEQLGRLTSELTLAEQRERERLANVLHDHLQQLLVAAAFGIERLDRKLTGHLIDKTTKDVLGGVNDLLHQAIDAARTLVADLSPPILHDGGLPDALEWLARTMKKRYDLTIALSLDNNVSPQRDDVRSVVFESVRESLFNVVKHAGCTEAQLELKRPTDGQLRIVIEDHGAGFDTDRLGRGGGPKAGFGLLSMQERLRFLGGTCIIESTPGKGTRVTLTAPLDASIGTQVDSQGDAKTRAPRQSLGTIETVRGTDLPLRILLVDDHVMMRQGLTMMLADEPDITVVGEASNGFEAIDQVKRLNPDLVLMDYSMPQMDGLQATRRIKEQWPGIRVIGLSMYDEADRAQSMLEAGASAYVAKTGGADALLNTIRRQGEAVS